MCRLSIQPPPLPPISHQPHPPIPEREGREGEREKCRDQIEVHARVPRLSPVAINPSCSTSHHPWPTCIDLELGFIRKHAHFLELQRVAKDLPIALRQLRDGSVTLVVLPGLVSIATGSEHVCAAFASNPQACVSCF